MKYIILAALLAAAPAYADVFDRLLLGGDSVIGYGVDMDKTDAEYRLYYALPGVEANKIKAAYLDRVLSVRAGDESKSDESRLKRAFSYSLRLPDDADEESIAAVYKNGLLTVTVKRDAKKAERKTKEIKIRQE